MKKDNKEKDDIFAAFLPDRVKDEPNENLKKEKKLYSVIFIIICTLLLVANLIAMIINFSTGNLGGGLLSLFVGFINCAISIFLLGLLVVLSHNISKMTRATLFICSKLMKDEKRFLEAEKKKKEEEKSENKLESNDGEAVVQLKDNATEQNADDDYDKNNDELTIEGVVFKSEADTDIDID